MEHAGFPSEETLAAYIDGRLDEKTRRRVVEHIQECDECYSVVVGTAAFHDEEGIARTARSNRTQLWIAAAVAALIAAIVVLGAIGERLRPAGTALLARSAGTHRHMEGRLAGFPYQSLQTMRGPNDVTKDPDNWKLMAAAARVQKDATYHRTPETLHALGVYYLLYGHYDEAIATLESALKMATGTASVPDAVAKSSDVHLLTDLAVAYESRGQNARDRLAAYEVINRAWKLEPRSPEVLWNRALAIEALSRDDAATAWTSYLQVDSSSRWSDEARDHLRHLRAPKTSELWERERPRLEAAALAGQQDRVNAIVSRFPFHARTWGEDELLPKWGRTRSAETLTVARAVGAALDCTSGERMLADSVAAIDRSSGRTREALAQGCAAYGEARELFDQLDIVHAKPRLELAAKNLEQGGSALGAFARLFLAGCAYIENRYNSAVPELVRVQRLEAPRRHFALLARAYWIHGLVEEQVGHPYEAVALYQRSFDTFARIHEDDSEAAADGLMADAFERIGEPDEAMNHALRAVDVVAMTGTRFRFHRIVSTAAQIAVEQRYTAAAELLLNHLAAFDAKSSIAAASAETLLMLGMAYQNEGDHAQAARAIRRGWEYGRAISDPRQRDRFSSFALAALVGSGASPIPRTTGSLTSAIDFFHTNGSRAALAQLYAERGEVSREDGRPDLAERDFERSMEELETERAHPPMSLFAVEQPFDSMLRLLIEQHRYGAALLVADRANGLHVAPSATRLLSASAMQSMLPNGVVTVVYHVMSDRLLIWTVTRRLVEFHAIRTTKDQVRSTIAALAGDAATVPDPDSLRPAAVAAGRLLLGSWLGSIPRNATIVFVPDQIVDDVPFAALIDPVRNRFLIEEHPLATSGSMAAFIRCMTVDRSRRDSTEAVFASPAPAQMQRLPYSEREIENASLGWSRHTLLQGGDATKAEFLERSRNAAIIHFAGHAKISDPAPMTSALVFPDTLLYMSELSEKAFDHARLFVLAACSTARQPRPGISFAAALTAQSVPSVVASLWDADDHSSAVLFTRFYQELRRGAGRATALQHAQLSLLYAADPDLRKPASWAGFQMIGAVGPIVQERNNV